MVVRGRTAATPVWEMRGQLEGVGRVESQASDHRREDGLPSSLEGQLGGRNLWDVFSRNYMGWSSPQSLNPLISHA